MPTTRNLDSVKVLSERFAEVPATSLTFATSLLYQHATKGGLSDKQWAWVDTLADKIECTGVPDFTRPAKKTFYLKSGGSPNNTPW